jgi:death-on-curing protein
MRFLTVEEVLRLHKRAIQQNPSLPGVRDRNVLESAVANPRQSWDGEDLYADLASKTSTLGFGIIKNHPFLDGNKRVGHAAMEMMLLLNGYELRAEVDDAEEVILGVASGSITRDALEAWVRARMVRSSLGRR